MKTYLFRAVVFGLCVWGYVLSQTTLPPSTWSEERGLVIGVNHIYNDPNAAQLRFIPKYPGLENYNESMIGIKFTNPYINFISVEVDSRTRTLYLYDYYLRSIVVGKNFSSAFDPDFMSFKYMHVGVSRGSIQIAIDWLSNTVYWSDSVFRWILAAPGEEEKINLDFYKIIADDHLDAPDGLAVDPLEGYLFWSDNGKHPKIERSNLDGTNRHTIITEHLQSPRSLETDIVGKRIYWVDSKTEAIISAKYDGSDVTMVTRVVGSSLLDIAVFRDILYVTNIDDDDLLTLNKTNGKLEAAVINIYPETIYSVAVYGEEKQPLKQDQTDHCAILNCSQLCFTDKNGASCACAEGYILNKTTNKCDELYPESHKAIVYANTTHICLADIRVIAHFSYEPKCFYTAYSQRNTTTTAALPKTSTTTPTPKSGTTTLGTPTPPTTTPPPTVAPSENLKMIDLDMNERIVYFVTVGNTIYSRPIDLPLSNDDKEVKVYATGNVSGLAFDAEDGNNLYWCEYDTGNFYVTNVRDAAVTKIIPKGASNAQVTVRNPVSLLVLLEQRRLAWIAGSPGSMSIQTMDLDGTDHKVVLSASTIGSLVADKEQKVFYYLYFTTFYTSIYQVSFDGSNGPTSILTVDKTSYMFIHYQNYFVWSYTSSGYGYLVKTNDKTLDVDIAHGYFENGTKLVDMKVLDPKLQTYDKISPCAVDNGDCSQVCITRYTNDEMTKTCECKLGYTLDSDGKTCKSVGMVNDNFILIADWTNDALYQVDLTTNDVHALPIPSVDLVMGVFYDSARKKVVWSQYYEYGIFSANLDGTGFETLTELDYAFPYRFAKDETTGNVYYTAYYWQHVGLITPDGKNIWLNDDFYFEDLGDIVVHPAKGYMFYTVNDSPLSYVARCRMDGTMATNIISTDGFPDGLAIDYTNDRLFWSDATYDTIQSCDFNGKDCQTLVNISSDQAEQIRDLETDGEYLYYSSYVKDHVIRFNIKSPDQREVIGRNTGFGRLDTISMYKSTTMNIQPENGRCKARGGLGDCSTICVPVPDGRKCMCEDGVDLRPDGRTCENVHQCDDVILQRGTYGEDIEVTFDSSCLRHNFENCTYRCPSDYVPVNPSNTVVTCTVVGWDIYSGRVNQTLCEEVRCPAIIKNGALSANCDRGVGKLCDFTCNEGYVKTEEKTFCTKNGTFHKDTSEFCAAKKCPETIPHGSLNSGCTRDIGSQCTVTCGKFYIPSGSALSCTKDGWNVDINTFCQELKCPASIENGVISADCSREVGKSCSYLCNKGYTATADGAFCTQTGMYHKNRTEFCKEVSIVPVTPAPQTASEPSLSSSGAIAGLTILVVAVVALIVVIFFLIWRTRSRSPQALYDTASFRNGGNVAIENPGYIVNQTAVERVEHPYAGLDRNQMQPVSLVAAPQAEDDGKVNPLYNQEPLPDVDHLQANQDKQVLTFDSWKKEQENRST